MSVESWLKRKFGVDSASLDEETRQLANKLGEGGVSDLVSSFMATRPYRNTRLTPEERVRLIQQIERLQQEGGGKWAEGEKPIGKDTPITWIANELEYLD